MNVFQMSFSGAMFILAVVIIRVTAIHKLPKKTFLVLWEIVLLRLLIPFSIPSIFSVYSFINQSTPVYRAFTEEQVNDILPITSQEQFDIMHETHPLSISNLSSISIWFMIWCIGLILCAAFFTISYLRCRFEFQTSLPVHNDFIKHWLKVHPLKRRISIRQSDRISVPLTYGVFHPVILMPKKTDWENIEQLQYILLHEYMHICHYDTVRKLVSTLALCIHWFNPFVWIMYILFNRDMELACDESVVQQFGETSKSTYALMLISMGAKKSELTPFCNNFNKNSIEERIIAIMKIKKSSLLTIFIAIGLIIGVTTTFATSATTNTKKLTMISNTEFSDEEYAKLLDLQFDGYENMTISQYQKRFGN